MTVADPRGLAVDLIRSCYSADMRVPEYANPIRVRWYRVPDTTAFRIWPDDGFGSGDPYTSSNWDEDRSFNPVVGEQSTTRNPVSDWRKCMAPPFTIAASIPFLVSALPPHLQCQGSSAVYTFTPDPARPGQWVCVATPGITLTLYTVDPTNPTAPTLILRFGATSWQLLGPSVWDVRSIISLPIFVGPHGCIPAVGDGHAQLVPQPLPP